MCLERATGAKHLHSKKQTFKENMLTPPISYLLLYIVCSLAGALMAGVLQQRDTDSCVRMGLLAARLSLVSPHPIAPSLTFDSVDPNTIQTQDWPKPNFIWID